jgi:hypothetical protein
VFLVDGNNNLASVGSGTQYTDGSAAPTHPVGTQIMYNNAGTETAVSAANPLPVSATVNPPANQRVSAQANDFLTGSIVDLATLLTLAGTPTDANTVNSLMGRLTKIRDLLNTTLTVQGTITEANSAASKADLDTIVTNTNKIPASPAQEGGNLASILSGIGALGDAAWSLSGNGSEIAILKKLALLLQNVAYDNTNELKISNYVKTSSAGDTALTLAQATMANSLPVTMASDQTPKTTSTATKTSVAAAASDTAILSSNSSRKGAKFYNDSTAICYLSEGSGAASTSSYTVQIPANGFYEQPPEPVYTGAYRAIWSAANGNLRITENT